MTEPSKFWRYYMIVNGLAIVALVAVMIWAAFDIHNRLAYVFLMQIPVLLMMFIRRAMR